MSGKIFINYRRGEDSGFVHALMSPLEQAFSAERLFIDIDSIEPGVDFVRVLDEQVAKCDILLAVIGKGWLEARDETNQRRLDNPDDFVRIEIEAALNHGKRVIPVLVGDARMPRSDELPDALRPLAKRGGVRLTHERFRADTADFINKLKKSLDGIEHERGNEASGNSGRGSLAQTLRLIVPSRQGTAPRRWLTFTVVGLAVVGVVSIFLWMGSDSKGPVEASSSAPRSADSTSSPPANAANPGKGKLGWDIELPANSAAPPSNAAAPPNKELK